MTHDISYKTYMSEQPLHIRFSKVDGIIGIYNGTRYLELFGLRIYNAVYDRINYSIKGKSNAKFTYRKNNIFS